MAFSLDGKHIAGGLGAPWSLVILGGTEIGPDNGYGPARYLLPTQVREIAVALREISRADLAKRFEPRAMDAAGTYPQIWTRDGFDGLDYLLVNFDQVVEQYQEAAANNQAMLLYLD